MRITRKQIEETKSTHFYVYSDDFYGKSWKGQAATCAGLSNTFAITTKKWCCDSEPRAFYHDEEFELLLKPRFHSELEELKTKIKGRKLVILPKMGQGRAQLQKYAPRFLAYMQEELQKLVKD